MENKNKKIIITLIVLFVILLGLIFWVIFNGKKNNNQPIVNKQHKTEQQKTVTKNQKQVVNNTKPVIKKSEKQPDDRSEIMNASRFFIERYGSFSTQANWQNLKDLKSSVTQKLWNDFENLMTKTEIDQKNYRSLSTKILNLRIVSQGTTKATTKANTQKKEISKDGEKIFYQDITVYLIKQGNNWLIDGFKQDKESR